MNDAPRTEEDHVAQAKRAVIDAALPHVVFDGWTLDQGGAPQGAGTN